MRAALPAALALLLAGCTAPQAPSPSPPAAHADGWALDCTLGSHEPGPWLQRCEARASHTEGPKQEIWLAVNPTDPRNVAIGAKDNNPESSAKCVWNGVSVTHDGGRTWKDVVIGGRYSERTPDSPYFGFACNTDPMLAFSADGTLHYVVEMYNVGGQDSHGPLGPDPVAGRALLLPGWKLVLATSHDGGDTWPDAALLDAADGISEINDYSRITVSPTTGTILTAINTFSGGPFLFAGSADDFCSVIASRDNGKSADPPVLVTATRAPRGVGCQAIAAAPSGTIVLAASSAQGLEGGGGTSWWAWSTDDGKSFSDPQPGFAIDPIPGKFDESEYRTGTNFELAYDHTGGPRKGTLYVIYASDPQGDADIFVRSSEDDGHTWGEPVRVNGDPTTHHQFIPNIVVARDGSVHAFFMDKRWDPANKLIDITHAVSVDGGLAWRDERVTTASFDGDLGVHQEGFPFIGDYIGIGAGGDEVWGAFPDASNGNTTVVAAARVVGP
jgi:hypothetical protein